ncbi:ribonuclease P protein component [bacterium]|nr:MAG: ribonuclease P protein component [bacterium]
MLPAIHRLRSRSAISRVYQRGVFGRGDGLLTIKATPQARTVAGLTPPSRAVVVVSKKIDKRAVVRNRLRRQLIEVFRSSLETVSPGYDIVITVQSDFRQSDVATIRSALHQALQRSGVSMSS